MESPLIIPIVVTKERAKTTILRKPSSSIDLINLSSIKPRMKPNQSTNTVFHANDSFFLHKGQSPRTFSIVSDNDTLIVDKASSESINHTKTMFENIKHEQQKLFEQANKNIIDLESTGSQSVISIPIEKPKKRVSFNENLLEVHLIPTNENIDDSTSSFNEDYNTNGRKLFSS